MYNGIRYTGFENDGSWKCWVEAKVKVFSKLKDVERLLYGFDLKDLHYRSPLRASMKFL